MLEKNKKILEAMDALDERFIEEAEAVRFRPRRGRRVVALAASLALVIGILTVSLADFDTDAPIPTQTVLTDYDHYLWDVESGLFILLSSNTTTTSASGAPTSNQGRYETECYPSATRTENATSIPLSHSVQYPYIEGAYHSYVQLHTRTVNRAHVGDVISDVSMSDGSGNTVGPTLYAIKDIDTACAVCVAFSDNPEQYRLYINSEMSFASFAAFKDAYSLQEHLFIGSNIMVEYSHVEKTERLYQLAPVTDIMKFRILQADGESLSYEEFLANCKSYEGVGINASHGRLIGMASQGIRVFKEGYLMTNIGGTLRFFEIGEESAQSIIAAAKQVAGEEKNVVIYGAEDGLFEENPEIPETEPVGIPEIATTGKDLVDFPKETTAAAPYLPTETTTARLPLHPDGIVIVDTTTELAWEITITEPISKP